ncbi:hypothetical protein [Sphingobium boeckii]|uniref:Uncharacterized protein n=1 Tax=Sphingobium boeckii TaxID=1082345 RepID=A0A7W9AIT4_9SPHN|nr:hypothetical protein [Sphingobium boeckii]MBB5686276.1 hypothetical protein [Sphingobium boeckii]
MRRHGIMMHLFRMTAPALVLGVAAGAGIAAMTDGSVDRAMMAREGTSRTWANPDALFADRYGPAPATLAAAGPIICTGCGPGLAERRAMAEERAYDRMLADYAAQVNDDGAAVDEAAYEPAVRVTADERRGAPRSEFEESTPETVMRDVPMDDGIQGAQMPL